MPFWLKPFGLKGRSGSCLSHARGIHPMDAVVLRVGKIKVHAVRREGFLLIPLETDGMATLSEANALQQETAEEEVQTTDEMVDAEASQACQPKGSQDGVEGKEEHVKQGQQARMRGLRHSRKSSRRGLKQGQQAKMTNLRQSQKRSRRGLKQSQQAKNFG